MGYEYCGVVITFLMGNVLWQIHKACGGILSFYNGLATERILSYSIYYITGKRKKYSREGEEQFMYVPPLVVAQKKWFVELRTKAKMVTFHYK